MELDRLKKLYREARDNTDKARKEADLAQDYYDNKQWTSEQIKALRKRKQPEIWINRIAPAVNGILGVLEQGESDPRAFPRTEDDQDAAEVATDALRYAADNCRWGRTKLAAAKTYLVTGVGAVIVEVDEKRDPIPRIIRHGEFIYDPHSRDPDFEDARYMGVAKWMYVDLVKAAYPGADVDPKALPSEGMQWDDEDKPNMVWGDSAKNRVLVCELYINEQGWQRVVFWGGGILEEGESPYQDEEGRSSNPIVAQSCFVDRDNARYGIVKAMVPIQDEINMRRSRLLHLANSRQVRITDLAGPEQDADVIRAEAARPDGVLPAGVEPAATGDMQAGQIQLLQESKSELERMGPNPAVLGQGNADASGRAQLVRQQAGLTELTPALGGIEDLELRVYRQMWARIKQFWDEPKMVRVTDDIGAPKFLMVNEPVMGMVPDPTQQPTIGMDPNGMPAIIPAMVPGVVEMKNRPAEMDMDIIIEGVPDTANIQQEQFAELVKLAGIYGPQEVPFEDLLEASSLPKKRQLIEKRKGRQEEAMQGQAPQQQMQQAVFQVEMEGKQAKTALDTAKTEQTQVETQINALQAGYQLEAGGMANVG
jgi:hypothetical protein